MTADQIAERIASHPLGSSPEAQRVLKPQAFDEKTYDRERKAKQRASGRELYIPVPKNIPLRLACLQDPELLLSTYFPATYYEPFTADRRDMLLSIKRAAMYGGDQAIAAPRGEGKTTLAMDGAFYLMLASLSFFPVVIGKNQDASSDELRALRERVMASERFIEDFPEVGVPLQSIGPATANARLQTVGGKFTGMYLGVKHFALPKIETEQLPHWPPGLESIAHGQVIGAIGIEGRIRGFKFRSHRPTLAIIDDVEDKNSVRSDEQIAKIESIIEEDIGGMGSSAERIARVYPGTTLNRRCNAYKYTDPKQKPSWNGRRYRKMIKPPSRMDLVEQYIEMRRMRANDDPDAREAFKFWKENQELIEVDCVVSNPYSYNKKLHADGEPLELSACHSYYNRVADVGKLAVSTEIDNDPPEEVGPQDNGLTAQIVSSRISGLAKLQLPANTTALTAAIDLGQYYCHWVVTAWWTGAGGVVVDYGFVSVLGAEKNQGLNASELLIYQALLNWRDEISQKNYTDATGTVRKIDRCFVDSGDFTNAAYEFCRQVRGPFFPSKGQSPFHAKSKSTEVLKAGSDVYAQWQESEKVWLHHLNTDYWKGFIHERFLTPTFDEQNMLRRGSLSLYHTEKAHSMYSQHIVAEQYLTEFKEGKGEKKYWHKVGPDNHWLDATYMAAAAAEAMGIRLLAPSEVPVVAKQKEDKPRPQQHGRFKQREGGWVAGLRNRRGR